MLHCSQRGRWDYFLCQSFSLRSRTFLHHSGDSFNLKMVYFSTFPVDLVTCWPPPISQEMFFSAATKTNFRPLSFFCVRSVPHTTHVPRAIQAPHLSFSRQQRLRDPDLNFVPFLLTNGIRRLSLRSLRDNVGLQNLPTPTTCDVNDLSNT